MTLIRFLFCLVLGFFAVDRRMFVLLGYMSLFCAELDLPVAS